MELSERSLLFKIVGDVMEYYKQDTSEFALQIWWEAMKGFELEQVSKALTAHAVDPDRGQFPPKVADIVRVLQGTATEKAALAWGKVYEAMQLVGAYQDICFDDKAIHAAIRDLGGWAKVCRTSTEEMGYLQHKFCEAHRAYSARGEYEYPRALIGDRSPDGEYTKRGLPIPAPRPFGNVEKARLVYKEASKEKGILKELAWTS